MKKITLLLILMISSLGFSQVLPLNFSNSNQLMAGQEGTTSSIVSDTGNDVLQIVGGIGLYDHVSVILAQNVNLADDANNTITFRIKSNVTETRNHLLKFEQGVGGPATAELAFTTTGTDWQNISLNFPAGLGNYAKIVIFTDFNNTLTGTYRIDDFAGGTNVSAPVIIAPTVAAPTPPVRVAADVMNFYSSAYTEIAGTNWNPNWGQTTVATEVQIAGNATRRMTNLNYQGAQFAAAQNVSAMNTLHLDLWTPDCTSFKVFLIGGGESSVTLTPTLSGWNSFDVPLTSYTVPNLSSIIQLKFESVNVGTTVYLDNIYFWKPAAPAGTPVITGFSIPTKYIGDAPFALTAPTSNSSGAFTYTSSNTSVATVSGSTVTVVGVGSSTITANQAASGSFTAASVTTILNVLPLAAPTPPVRDASNVISLFSNAYTNVTLAELPTSWSQTLFSAIQIQGNDTWKSVGEFLAMVTNYTNGINLSTMDKMHIDYYTTDNNPIGIKIVNTLDGGEALASLGTTVTGSWQSVDIDMSAFGSTLNKTKITQLLIDPIGNSTIYIDNFYFWKTPLAVNTFDTPKVKMYPNPTSSVFTIEANDVIENVTLYNVLGQQVLAKTANGNSVTLDVANLQTGVYVVKTMIGGVAATSRLVKN